MLETIYRLRLFFYKRARQVYNFLKQLTRRLKFSFFRLAVNFGSNQSIKQKKLLMAPRGSYILTRDWTFEKKYADPDALAEFISIEPERDIQLITSPKAVSYHRSPLFESRVKRYRVCELFVAKTTNGRIWGRNGAVITPDGYVLEDLSLDYKRLNKAGYLKHSALRDWSVSSVRQIPGRVAVLTHPASYIYFHWMLEVLPRLELLRKANFSLSNFDAFIFSTSTRSFQRQTLSLIGIPEEKIIDCPPDMVIQAEEMVIPSQLTGHQMRTGFREWILDYLNGLIGDPNIEQSQCQNSRIYIRRGKAKIRRIINEEAVIHKLKHYGFVPVSLENYSVAEQKHIMASAEAVVAPHGSGLTNLVFCKPGTKVIELFPVDLLAPEYPRLSLLKGIEYYYAFSTGQIKDDWDTAKNRSADILVDLNILEETLELTGLTPTLIPLEV
jgi:capsular polysaccharide biosynthesis protein